MIGFGPPEPGFCAATIEPELWWLVRAMQLTVWVEVCAGRDGILMDVMVDVDSVRYTTEE